MWQSPLDWHGTNAGETRDGGPNQDIFYADEGNDNLFGHGARDFLCANPGEDHV